jgi:tRNA (guanine-N7-)-methyltransferase
MRLRKKPWITEAIKQYSAIILQPPLAGGWRLAFGRAAPLHVELGIGRGRFIATLAELQPQVNFVGIESRQDVLYDAAQRIHEQQLTNVRLVLADVGDIMAIFAAREIDRLYINFCDPWPKTRHAKRRLTHSRFLAKYQVVVRPGGELFFKTDNQQLFEFSLDQLASQGFTLRQVSFDQAAAPDDVMTEYEAKFRARGAKICRCEASLPTIM